MSDPFSSLNSISFYAQHFMDRDLWAPHVQTVYQRHSSKRCHSMRSGLAGTYPTFIADDRWVIKFFGRLFAGERTWQIELEAARLLAQDPAIPAARLVASGQLFDPSTDWPWPYLVFEYLPGISIGEVHSQLCFEDKLILARQLGVIARRLHSLPLTDSTLFLPTWDALRSFLAEQRANCVVNQRRWGVLPPTLISQIESYWLPFDQLFDPSSTPHLIHADLTQDHILGRLDRKHWVTTGIIDFGDAMVADLAYELVALHLDLFHCDTRLLNAFLDAYGIPQNQRHKLLIRAMNMALLHQFNVLAIVSQYVPDAFQVATLPELASKIWGI